MSLSSNIIFHAKIGSYVLSVYSFNLSLNCKYQLSADTHTLTIYIYIYCYWKGPTPIIFAIFVPRMYWNTNHQAVEKRPPDDLSFNTSIKPCLQRWFELDSFNNSSYLPTMCALSTLCGSADNRNPFYLYIYIHIYGGMTLHLPYQIYADTNMLSDCRMHCP